MFLAEPVVTTWNSCRLKTTCLNMVFSNMQPRRWWCSISQIIQEPSYDTETARLPSSESTMLVTRDRCSFILTFIRCTVGSMSQIRTSPSAPPETTPPLLRVTTAVTPWLCASLICYKSLPDLGANPLSFPSDQPLTTEVPSILTAMH